MVKTVAQMFQESCEKFPNLTFVSTKDNKGVFCGETYKQVEELVKNLAIGLKDTFKLEKQDLLGIISDNRKEWLYSDLAIQYLSCADVPRGLDATDVEIIQILNDTKVKVCFVENIRTLERFDRLKKSLPHLESLVLMEDTYASVNSKFNVVLLYDLIKKGFNLSKENPSLKKELLKDVANGKSEDLSTIIFTSGTTGKCKGVMLTNANFIYQSKAVQSLVDYKFEPGQKWMTVLPIWHSLERAVTYVAINHNHAIYYSKPISKIMLSDFQKVNPHWFSSVPRIWNSVNNTIEAKVRKTKGLKKIISLVLIKNAKKWMLGYNKVHNLLPQYKKKRFRLFDIIHGSINMVVYYPLYKLGKKMMFDKIKSLFGTNFIAGVCGGGSMPKGVDDFFNAIGITLLDGYGMTETSPIISVRNLAKPILGTMQIMEGCTVKIVDENNKTLGFNEKGVLKIKGPQVMKGYYNNKEETEKIIDKDGFLNTGDLVVKTIHNDISIVGRAKDTIVLAGGENLEPVPIEGKLSELDFIENVIVIGQDRKYLSALIVPNHNSLKEYLELFKGKSKDEKEKMYEFIKERIDEKVNSKTGFKNYEQINRFVILDKPFEVGKELSAKQELKRNVIEEYYKREIDTLYAS